MKACTRCGKCCTNESFQTRLSATGKDVLRWMDERRWDILRYAYVLGPDDNPYADFSSWFPGADNFEDLAKNVLNDWR